MVRIFIFSNGICFLEDDTANATFFDADVCASVFFSGTQILKLYTNKGSYRIHLEKKRFQIIDHINRHWVASTLDGRVEKGDLTV